MITEQTTRRNFLASLGTTFAAGLCVGNGVVAEDRPRDQNRRATDGDNRFQPDWDEKLTVTVGATQGDLIGKDDKVLQAALDYVARWGGGTVHVLPGTYTLRNAIFLPSNVRLLGSGADSVITKISSESAELSTDSDWYDQEITLKKNHGFHVGDGIVLRAKNPHHGGQIVIKRTLTARSGNRFKLDKGLRKNLWITGQPTCSSLFPLLTSEKTANVTIENITLDGNRKNNENFNGNYGGCVFLQDCNRYTMKNITTRNYNGDGISFQICHDVVVEECHSHNNADLGVHPGSGSQRPLIRNNKLERNSQGIFWCWGVKYGLAEGNIINGNSRYGMSIGHCDTDNVIRNNSITDSGQIGVLFRDDPRGQDFWANRNLLENNLIENSGGAEGIAIDLTGKTKDVRIIGNRLRESRGKMKRTAIRLGPDVGNVELAKNNMQGFAQGLVDHRTARPAS